MARRLRPVAHEDRLSLVEHLGELRNRLIACIVVFSITTGVCLWQNGTVLNVMNRPLERATNSKTSKDPLQAGAGPLGGAIWIGNDRYSSFTRRFRNSTRAP